MSPRTGPHQALPPPFTRSRLDVSRILDRLMLEDAVPLPILTQAFRRLLLAEAATRDYRRARSVVGSGSHTVRQRLEVQDQFADASLFRVLRSSFQALWDRSLGAILEAPFEGRLCFNDLMLQRYHVGEVGITPHRDRSAYRNLICLFVLAGRGRFYVCEDRTARGAREIAHAPGDVILTRAPGLRGSTRRPFHVVRHITATRYVFGLRHERRD